MLIHWITYYWLYENIGNWIIFYTILGHLKNGKMQKLPILQSFITSYLKKYIWYEVHHYCCSFTPGRCSNKIQVWVSSSTEFSEKYLLRTLQAVILIKCHTENLVFLIESSIPVANALSYTAFICCKQILKSLSILEKNTFYGHYRKSRKRWGT